MCTKKPCGDSLQTMPKREEVKMVIVGDPKVGKTTMIVSFMTRRFPEYEISSTIHDDAKVEIMIGGKSYSLMLSDTAGQSDYARLRPAFYANAKAVLICFSIVNPDSFSNVSEYWLPEVKHWAGGSAYFLVGTQGDQRYNEEVIKRLQRNKMRPVSEEDAKQKAIDIGAIGYYESSSKTLEGLDELFSAVVSYATTQHGGPRESPAVAQPSQSTGQPAANHKPSKSNDNNGKSDDPQPAPEKGGKCKVM